MPRVCYLHIGTRKTGSTSIQRSLDGYDDGKTRYLKLRVPNHSRILTALYTTEESARAQAIAKAKLTPAKADRWRAEMHTQIANHPSHNFIISGEALSTWCDLGMIASLKRDLADFDEIRLIAYLRNPMSWIASSFQQRLRNMAPEFDLSALFPMFRDWFSPWEQAFGPEVLTLARFDRSDFPNGDVVADFAARCGLSLPKTPPRQEKPALSAEAVSALYAYRMTYGAPSMENRTDALANRGLLEWLETLGQTPFQIDPKALAPIAQRFEDQIAWATHRTSAFAPHRCDDGPAFGCSRDLLNHAHMLVPKLQSHLHQLVANSARNDDPAALVAAAYDHIRERVENAG